MFKKMFVGIAMLVFVLSASSASAAPATGKEFDENVAIPKDRVVQHSLWKAGNTIDVSGTIEKDLYVAGNVVTIDGHVMGDVIGFANTVRINGTVDGNVRMAAQTITIDGAVGKNVTVAGQAVTLGPNGSVGGEFHAASSVIDLHGTINGNVSVTAAKTVVEKDINGYLWVEGDVNFAATAHVTGDVNYVSNTDSVVAPGARLDGKLNRVSIESVHPEAERSFSRNGIMMWIWSFLSVLAVAAVFYFLTPQLLDATKKEVIEHWGKHMFMGFLVIFVAPFAILLAIFTLIGVPLALITGALYLIALYVGKIFVAMAVATVVFGWFKAKEMPGGFILLLLGLLIITILKAIPYVGWLVSLAATWTGIGAMVAVVRAQIVKPLR